MGLDRNANSKLRLRRNAQRMRGAALSSSILLDPAGGLGLGGSGIGITDPELVAFKNVTSAADKLFYFTGSGTGVVTDLSAFARTLIDDATAGDARTTLGLGTLAVESLATDPGLELSSGLRAKLNGNSLERTSSGLRHIAFRTESSDPGSPADGDVWYNSTDKRIKQRINGATLRSSGLIGTTTAQASSVTSATETAFDQIVTIPANYFAAVGKAVKIRGVVRFNTGPDAATSLRIRVYVGGFTGTAFKSSGFIPVDVGITNNRSSFEVIAVCYSTGSSGTLATVCDQKFEDSTDLTDARVQSGGGATFTRDLTSSLDVVVTAQWLATGSDRAANLHMMIVEALN